MKRGKWVDALRGHEKNWIVGFLRTVLGEGPMARVHRLRDITRVVEGVNELFLGTESCRNAAQVPGARPPERRDDGSPSAPPEEGPEPVRSRKEMMLRAIDVRGKAGLEIGPLTNPVVTRQEGKVFYVDHLSTAELRKKYANDAKVDPNAICDIDFVWGGRTLRECLGREVDYIVASHVAEHVPDLAGWLAECQDALTEGGVLSLALPDKRYTFDHQRSLSTSAALVEAFCQRRRIPSAGQVYDHFANYCEVETAKAWSGKYPEVDSGAARANRQSAFAAANRSLSGEYIDSHCWVFTCTSFLELLRTTFELRLNRLCVVEFHPTQRSQLEFYVSLQKLGKSVSDEECCRAQLDSCNRRR